MKVNHPKINSKVIFMKYQLESIKVGSLVRSHHAFYTELSIQNHTRENIVVVDCHNNKHVVPPASSNQLGRELVSIWYRATTNPTVYYNNRPINADGIRIILSKHELSQEGGVFIQELNLLLCSQTMSTIASHPASSITYEDAVTEASELIAQTIADAPTVKLIANDPEGRYNKLYTVIGDMLLTIDVTHVYGDAELQVLYFNQGESQQFVVNLNEFFESAEEVLELKDLPITFLSTNKARATRCATDYRRVSQTEVDELLKKMQTRSNKEYTALKDKADTDNQLKDNEIARLRDQVKQLTSEKEEIEEKARAYKAAVNAANDLNETRIKEEQYRTQWQLSQDKVHMSNNDVRTSDQKRESAEKENENKNTQLLMAAILPVAGAIGLKLLEYAIKSWTSK